MKTTTTTARIYVGTYAKYNSGSIAGQWIDLEQYADDKEGFLAACAAVHADESDPEFMFQDFEGFPAGYYGESFLSDELFTEWLTLSEDDQQILDLYAEVTGYTGDDLSIDAARDAYAGSADSVADFAEQLATENGEIPANLPTWIVIDWEASWNCNLRHDYHTPAFDMGSGCYHFFRNI